MINLILLFLRGNWRPLALAAGVGLLAWQWHQRGVDLDAARLREALASEAAIRNAAAVDAVTRDAQRNVAALEKDAARAMARARDADQLERRLRDVPQTHDCVDSPAVRAGLDELRRRAAARAPGAVAGPAADPGKPADMQPGADRP